jgi:hypothetical protein
VSTLDLAVPTRDVAADALGLLLDAPAPPALASLLLRGAHGGELELGVLGASHVVRASAGGRSTTEQVSCDAVAAGGDPLPPTAGRPGYAFTATVEHLPAAELDRRAVQLRAWAAAADDRLCAGFPGHDAALTAVTGAATATGWTWTTWHLYPGAPTGQLVTTTSDWRPA